MHPPVARSPRWTTASLEDAADTMPMELRALGAHVSHCNGSRSRWFAARCLADSVHDFVAAKFVTTLLIAGALVGLAALVL